MNCEHPEAFVSIKNGHRVCGLCGAIVPEPAAAEPAEKKPAAKAEPAEKKPAAKAEPKKGGKANARK